MSINSVPELRTPGPSGRQRTNKKGHVADIPGQLAGVASPVMERYVRKIYVHVTYMYIVYTHDTHDITSYSVDGCRRCILDHRCIQQPRSGEGHLGPIYGGFLYGYPQPIQLLGYPHLWKPPWPISWPISCSKFM